MAEHFQDMLDLKKKFKTLKYLYSLWAKCERGFQMKKLVFSTAILKRTVLENKEKINYEKTPNHHRWNAFKFVD